MKFITLKKRNIFMSLTVGIALILAIVITALTGSAAVWNGRNPNIALVEYIQTDKNALVLSFNICGLGESDTRQIMDVLKTHDAKAVFFVTGKWAEQNSDLLKEMVLQGIEIGSHGSIHQDMRALDGDTMRLNLMTSMNIIENITGQKVTLFRPPHNLYNDRLLNIASSLGLRVIHYTTDSLDNNAQQSQENIIMTVLNNANKGAIILMRNDGIHTVLALPPILEALRIRGMSTATISELIA
ncbi:MAG: polysaccharide deacetylase family protein [Firmicutes bacterium]|nr:polysaccharide deacetylase family protein [Bacillota bacterium]